MNCWPSPWLHFIVFIAFANICFWPRYEPSSRVNRWTNCHGCLPWARLPNIAAQSKGIEQQFQWFNIDYFVARYFCPRRPKDFVLPNIYTDFADMAIDSNAGSSAVLPQPISGDLVVPVSPWLRWWNADLRILTPWRSKRFLRMINTGNHYPDGYIVTTGQHTKICFVAFSTRTHRNSSGLPKTAAPEGQCETASI